MKRILCAFLCVLAVPAFAADLPTTSITPGAVREGIIAKDLCPTAHTAKVRNVTAADKKAVYAAYGVKSHKPGEFEVDHLISLELGGSNDRANLWPQSYLTKPWNAHVKDRLENELHRLICAGSISVKEAQTEISTDWIRSYRKHLGTP